MVDQHGNLLLIMQLKIIKNRFLIYQNQNLFF